MHGCMSGGGIVHGGSVCDWCASCADNTLGAEGGKVVGEALKVNKTLLHLDLGGTQGWERGSQHGWGG